MLGEVADGKDPAAIKGAKKQALTIAELCNLYLAEGVSHKKPLTIKADRGRIEWHVNPFSGGSVWTPLRGPISSGWLLT